jgi:hypothetical protein
MKLGYKSQEQLAAERSVREAKREERIAKYGEAQPDAEEKKRIDSAEMAARAADVAKRAAQAEGATEEQAMAAGEEARSFSQATPAERYFAEARRRDKEMLGGFKTYGDKARFDQMNAVRKLQGKEALDADPLKQFDKDMSKSMAFGAESSLNTPEGRQRAMQAGVKAGLSFNDADAAVQGAFKRLQEIGKRDKALKAVPEQYGPPKGLAGAGAGAGVTAPTGARVTTPTAAPVTVEATPVEEGMFSKLGGAARGAALPVSLAATATRTLPSYVKGLQQTAAAAPKLSTAQAGLAAAEKGVKNVMRLGGNKVPLAGSPYESALGKTTARATQAAAEVSAAEKGLRAGAAAEKLAPVAKVAGKIAPAAKVLGKVATPLAVGAELYDTGRFAFSPEQREKMTREVEATAEKGALRSALGGAVSPMKTILGTGKLAVEALQSGSRARESEAAAKTAQSVSDARLAARRADYSDEEFKALSQEERSTYLKNLRGRIKAQ